VGERRGAKLAICNLQTTDIDILTDIRIFSEADVLMARVMEKLNLPIPSFVLRRHLVIKVESQEEDRHRVTATGVDTDGTPMTFLQSVRLEGSRRIVRAEPFIILVRETLQPVSPLKLDLEFMGHYDEPNLELIHEYNGEEEVLYLLEFNLQNGEWTIARREGLADATESLTIDS
jgi:mono-ADP-ribosyltransferase sirtuin 6